MAVGKTWLDDDTYTEKDQLLIELAARGESQGNMAATTGYSIRQVQRLLSEPKFRKAIRQFCRDLFETRMRKLHGHFDKVEECFVELVSGDNVPYVRIAAATQLKSMYFHAREHDVEQEMDEMRDQIRTIETRITGGAGVQLLENHQDAD